MSDRFDDFIQKVRANELTFGQLMAELARLREVVALVRRMTRAIKNPFPLPAIERINEALSLLDATTPEKSLQEAEMKALLHGVRMVLKGEWQRIVIQVPRKIMDWNRSRACDLNEPYVRELTTEEMLDILDRIDMRLGLKKEE